jgi:hypothetical protein
VPAARTEMTTVHPRVLPASEARSASLMKCPHHHHLPNPSLLHTSVHGGCPTESRSVATRSRLKRTRKKRMRKTIWDLPPGYLHPR